MNGLEIMDYLYNMITSIATPVDVIGVIKNNILYYLNQNSVLYTIDLSYDININDFYFKLDKDLGKIIITTEFIIVNRMNRSLQILEEKELLVDIDNIKEDENFNTIMSAKAGDGVFRYYVNTPKLRTFFTLHKSLLKLNKPDKVKLKIYDTDFQKGISPHKFFITEFEIFKKKINKNYTLKFLFMDINN